MSVGAGRAGQRSAAHTPHNSAHLQCVWTAAAAAAAAQRCAKAGAGSSCHSSGKCDNPVKKAHLLRRCSGSLPSAPYAAAAAAPALLLLPRHSLAAPLPPAQLHPALLHPAPLHPALLLALLLLALLQLGHLHWRPLAAHQQLPRLLPSAPLALRKRPHAARRPAAVPAARPTAAAAALVCRDPPAAAHAAAGPAQQANRRGRQWGTKPSSLQAVPRMLSICTAHARGSSSSLPASSAGALCTHQRMYAGRAVGHRAVMRRLPCLPRWQQTAVHSSTSAP